MAPHIDDRFRFARMRVAANASSAAQIRAEFGMWLKRNFKLDSERTSELLLAAYEAVANAAEFAYVETSRRGTIDVSASYDADSDTLWVTVNDRGRWRHISGPSSAERQYRGRGIALMRALADEARIDSTPRGTHVTLAWTQLTRSASTA
jgi:serine/threonine-protein kinase RsbW